MPTTFGTIIWRGQPPVRSARLPGTIAGWVSRATLLGGPHARRNALLQLRGCLPESGMSTPVIDVADQRDRVSEGTTNMADLTIDIGIDEADREAIIEGLSRLLADTYTL